MSPQLTFWPKSRDLDTSPVSDNDTFRSQHFPPLCPVGVTKKSWNILSVRSVVQISRAVICHIVHLRHIVLSIRIMIIMIYYGTDLHVQYPSRKCPQRFFFLKSHLSVIFECILPKERQPKSVRGDQGEFVNKLAGRQVSGRVTRLSSCSPASRGSTWGL